MSERVLDSTEPGTGVTRNNYLHDSCAHISYSSAEMNC